MEITKHIEIGEYRFELTLKSKSTHAHSLMTDHKETLDKNLAEYIRKELLLELAAESDFHKAKYKG